MWGDVTNREYYPGPTAPLYRHRADDTQPDDRRNVVNISQEIQERVALPKMKLTGEDTDVDIDDFKEMVESVVMSSADAIRMEDRFSNKRGRGEEYARSMFLLDKLLIRTAVLCCTGVAERQARLLSQVYVRKEPKTSVRAWHAFLAELAEAIGPKDLVMHYIRMASRITYSGDVSKLVRDLAHFVKSVTASQSRIFNGLLAQGPEQLKELGLTDKMDYLRAPCSDTDTDSEEGSSSSSGYDTDSSEDTTDSDDFSDLDSSSSSSSDSQGAWRSGEQGQPIRPLTTPRARMPDLRRGGLRRGTSSGRQRRRRRSSFRKLQRQALLAERASPEESRMPVLEPRAAYNSSDVGRSPRHTPHASATISRQVVRPRSDVRIPTEVEAAHHASRSRSSLAQDNPSYWRGDRADRYTVQLREEQLDESKRYGESHSVEDRTAPMRAFDGPYPSSSASPFVAQSSSFSEQGVGLGQDSHRFPTPRFQTSKVEAGLGQDSFQSPAPSWVAAQRPRTEKLASAVPKTDQKDLRSFGRGQEPLLSTPRPEDHRRILDSLDEVGDRLVTDGSAVEVSVEVTSSPKATTERPDISYLRTPAPLSPTGRDSMVLLSAQQASGGRLDVAADTTSVAQRVARGELARASRAEHKTSLAGDGSGGYSVQAVSEVGPSTLDDDLGALQVALVDHEHQRASRSDAGADWEINAVSLHKSKDKSKSTRKKGAAKHSSSRRTRERKSHRRRRQAGKRKKKKKNTRHVKHTDGEDPSVRSGSSKYDSLDLRKRFDGKLHRETRKKKHHRSVPRADHETSRDKQTWVSRFEKMSQKQQHLSESLMEMSAGFHNVSATPAQILGMIVGEHFLRRTTLNSLRGRHDMLAVAKAQKWPGGLRGLFAVIKRAEDDLARTAYDAYERANGSKGHAGRGEEGQPRQVEGRVSFSPVVPGASVVSAVGFGVKERFPCNACDDKGHFTHECPYVSTFKNAVQDAKSKALQPLTVMNIFQACESRAVAIDDYNLIAALESRKYPCVACGLSGHSTYQCRYLQYGRRAVTEKRANDSALEAATGALQGPKSINAISCAPSHAGTSVLDDSADALLRIPEKKTLPLTTELKTTRATVKSVNFSLKDEPSRIAAVTTSGCSTSSTAALPSLSNVVGSFYSI